MKVIASSNKKGKWKQGTSTHLDKTERKFEIPKHFCKVFSYICSDFKNMLHLNLL